MYSIILNGGLAHKGQGLAVKTHPLHLGFQCRDFPLAHTASRTLRHRSLLLIPRRLRHPGMSTSVYSEWLFLGCPIGLLASIALKRHLAYVAS
jgi:hypothetical protein